MTTVNPLLKIGVELITGVALMVNELAEDVPNVVSPETVNEPEFVSPFVTIPPLNVCNLVHVLAFNGLAILDSKLVNFVLKPLIATIGKELLGTVKPLLNVAFVLTISFYYTNLDPLYL